MFHIWYKQYIHTRSDQSSSRIRKLAFRAALYILPRQRYIIDSSQHLLLGGQHTDLWEPCVDRFDLQLPNSSWQRILQGLQRVYSPDSHWKHGNHLSSNNYSNSTLPKLQVHWVSHCNDKSRERHFIGVLLDLFCLKFEANQQRLEKMLFVGAWVRNLE